MFTKRFVLYALIIKYHHVYFEQTSNIFAIGYRILALIGPSACGIYSQEFNCSLAEGSLAPGFGS